MNHFPELIVNDQIGVCGVRDDTRALARMAAEAAKPGRALDMGAGTGYVGLYLAQRGWQVDAVDVSQRALELVRANAERNGVSMNAYLSDLFDQVQGSFDVIAFNAPMRPDETELSRIVTSLLRRSPQVSRFLMAVVGERFENNRSEFLERVVAGAKQHLNIEGRVLLGINAKEVAEIACVPGVRLLREQPIPGMEPQVIVEFCFEVAP